VARHYGTRHTNRLVTRAEFEADLPAIFESMDQPSIDGINTWFASKAAAECGMKVVLSGLGGDELFGGYSSFGDIPRATRWFGAARAVPGLGASLRQLAQPLIERLGLHPKSAGLVELGATWSGAFLLRRGLFMPWELAALMDPEAVRVGLKRLHPLERIEAEIAPWPGSPFASVATLETAIYMRNQLLRDTDWASMAHSLEVRVPLVDATLLDALAGWRDATRVRDGKRMLAQAPSRPLPEEIVQRRKTGFSTPIAEWTEKGQAEGQDASHGARTWARQWARTVAEQFGFPLRSVARGLPAHTVDDPGALS
jgi:asparagine synthase (glutamine-hydrolysing)